MVSETVEEAPMSMMHIAGGSLKVLRSEIRDRGSQSEVSEVARRVPEIRGQIAREVAEVPKPDALKILIADDHEVVRAGLRSILELHEGWSVVDEACDGKEAVAKAVAIKPHVAVIDQSLPLMNGVEVTRQIRSRSPCTEVLAFATHDSEQHVAELLRAGARACILKSDDRRILVHAVEALALHQPFFTGSLSQTMLDVYLSRQKGRGEGHLSPREQSIVQLIAEGHSNKDMSRILCLSIKTIETHRASAMRKLGITSIAGLVRYAIRNRLVEP
jgi:DNA-binding NarL/FixJ family response regulator